MVALVGREIMCFVPITDSRAGIKKKFLRGKEANGNGVMITPNLQVQRQGTPPSSHVQPLSFSLYPLPYFSQRR